MPDPRRIADQSRFGNHADRRFGRLAQYQLSVYGDDFGSADGLSERQYSTESDTAGEKCQRHTMILAKGVSLNYSYHGTAGTQLLFFSVTK